MKKRGEKEWEGKRGKGGERKGGKRREMGGEGDHREVDIAGLLFFKSSIQLLGIIEWELTSSRRERRERRTIRKKEVLFLYA
jgi:hypothetical protein